MTGVRRVLRRSAYVLLLFFLLVVPMAVLTYNAVTGVSPVGYIVWVLLLLLALPALLEWVRDRRERSSRDDG